MKSFDDYSKDFDSLDKKLIKALGEVGFREANQNIDLRGKVNIPSGEWVKYFYRNRKTRFGGYQHLEVPIDTLCTVLNDEDGLFSDFIDCRAKLFVPVGRPESTIYCDDFSRATKTQLKEFYKYLMQKALSEWNNWLEINEHHNYFYRLNERKEVQLELRLPKELIKPEMMVDSLSKETSIVTNQADNIDDILTKSYERAIVEFKRGIHNLHIGDK